MDLGAYIERIGFAGEPRADLVTLRGLVRAHINTIPFENLDVQLGRPLTLDPADAYRKVVDGRRGGWCYELNGLFGWALGELGFTVRRMSGAVLRDRLGDVQNGTHLCLLVTLDQDYLVDVGFGSSLAAPLPLEEGRRGDAPFTVGLDRVEAGYWRFVERTDGEPFTFDFLTDSAEEAELARQCERQQSDPGSPFVRNLVAQRRDGDAHLTQRGAVFTRTDAGGARATTLTSGAELASSLRDRFGLDVPQIAECWPVGARDFQGRADAG